MATDLLLESYLKTLGLRAFRENYRKLAEEANHSQLSYERFLLALAEQEVALRDANRRARLIQQARFPALKELSDFDFSRLEGFHTRELLTLAESLSFLERAEPGPQGPFLQHRRPGQRPDPGPGGAPPAEGHHLAAETPSGHPGRAGLHPLLAHRRSAALPALLRSP
jgi:hypothetical protein